MDFAYGQLVAEGYLEAKPHRGYFVSRVEELLELTSLPVSREKGFNGGIFLWGMAVWSRTVP